MHPLSSPGYSRACTDRELACLRARTRNSASQGCELTRMHTNLASMAQIQSLLGLVDRILDHIEDGALDGSFREPIQRGSASGLACVVPDRQDPDSLLLVVQLSIMRAPASNRARLYERLLELNHTFNGRAAFSLADDGIVYLTSGRPVEHLDPGEIIDLILWTSEQADDYDNILLAEFGDEHEL